MTLRREHSPCREPRGSFSQLLQAHAKGTCSTRPPLTTTRRPAAPLPPPGTPHPSSLLFMFPHLHSTFYYNTWFAYFLDSLSSSSHQNVSPIKQVCPSCLLLSPCLEECQWHLMRRGTTTLLRGQPLLPTGEQATETGKKAGRSSLACLVLKKLPYMTGHGHSEDTDKTQSQAEGREGRGGASGSQSLSRWKHSEGIQVLLALTWPWLNTVFYPLAVCFRVEK